MASCDTLQPVQETNKKTVQQNYTKVINMRKTRSDQGILEADLPIITSEQYSEVNETVPPEDFQKIMLEAVDEAFSCMGKETKQLVYSLFEKTFKIARRDIPFEIEKFTGALEEIFGPGAKLLEIEVMKHLYEKIGSRFKYSPRQETLTFKEYLAAISAFLSTGNSTRKPMPNEYYDYKFC
jgi:hypothetical protein